MGTTETTLFTDAHHEVADPGHARAPGADAALDHCSTSVGAPKNNFVYTTRGTKIDKNVQAVMFC